MENNSDPRIMFTHPQLRIVKADALNRPTNARLLQAAGARAVDSRGSDLTAHMNANLENIDFSVPGQHDVPVAVMDDRGNVGRSFFTLIIVNSEADLDGRAPIVVESAPESAAASQAATTATQTPKKKKNHRRLIIGSIAALVLLIGIIWGVSAHNAAQRRADAESAAASSRQASLASQNSGLSSQVNDLKSQAKASAQIIKDLQKTVSDYKQSSDRAQYENSMNNISQQISSLQNQLSQSTGNSVSRGIISSQLNKLADTVSTLENSTSPDNANAALKDSGIDGLISKIQGIISSF